VGGKNLVVLGTMTEPGFFKGRGDHTSWGVCGAADLWQRSRQIFLNFNISAFFLEFLDYPPTSSVEVQERVELDLYSPSVPSWQVIR
jgi:hypothetical protein